MFAEFRFHGEQINVEEVVFSKMVEIKDDSQIVGSSHQEVKKHWNAQAKEII